MKRPVLFAAALAAISLSASAAFTSAQEQRPAGQQRQEQRPATGQQRQEQSPAGQQGQQAAGKALSKSDREFVDKAALGNLVEVSLGQAALQRAESVDVKRFAQRMIDDHTAANAKLTDITRSKGITPPQVLDQKHQEKVDKLSRKTGAEFDRDYMKEMVDDHKRDVDEFEKVAKDTDRDRDPDIKSYAASTLPTLKEHLTHAQQIRDKVKGK
jgi:putative membrane protein